MLRVIAEILMSRMIAWRLRFYLYGFVISLSVFLLTLPVTGQAESVLSPISELRRSCELNEEEYSIISHLFRGLGIQEESMMPRQGEPLITIKIPVRQLNLNALKSAFSLETDPHPDGEIQIVYYQRTPFFLMLVQEGPIHLVDLTRYYIGLDSVIPDMIWEQVRATIFRSIKKVVFDPYLYAAFNTFDGRAIDFRLNATALIKRLQHVPIDRYRIRRFPILPGVFHNMHSSNRMSLQGAIINFKPGMKVLFVCPGMGVEACVIGEKGGVVDSVDMNSMPIVNTGLLCRSMEQRVRCFKNDLMEGLGTYDLVVANLQPESGQEAL
ncbi:MAG: hypothetical protein JW774_01355, partial [Candidatus Aureabacteria bacterium]|nr:hypothetical protein [Candidatus Auribacterota bacterium]